MYVYDLKPGRLSQSMWPPCKILFLHRSRPNCKDVAVWKPRDEILHFAPSCSYVDDRLSGGELDDAYPTSYPAESYLISHSPLPPLVEESETDVEDTAAEVDMRDGGVAGLSQGCSLNHSSDAGVT